jgi:hypothetical protein
MSGAAGLTGELAKQCYAAGNLITVVQEGSGGHRDSHCGRQLVVWWWRRADEGDAKAAVNPSEDSSLGARRGEVEWHNAKRWRMVRW